MSHLKFHRQHNHSHRFFNHIRKEHALKNLERAEHILNLFNPMYYLNKEINRERENENSPVYCPRLD